MGSTLLLPEGEITDISQLPTTIPSYLVNVVPELAVNGQVVKTGGAMKLGEELPFVTALSFAGRGQVYAPRTYHVIAGSYLAVNAYAGSVSPAQLQAVKARLEQTKTVLASTDQNRRVDLPWQSTNKRSRNPNILALPDFP